MHSKNLVFAAACLGMLLFGIVFLSLGSVNNMLAERFELDDNAIGTLTALLPLGILLGSAVFGPVVDMFGYRWMLVGAALAVGVALEGLAFAGSERHVQLFIFLIGFGGGILNGATNALVADVSESDRGAKLSLLGVFFGIGALTMPTALATLSRHFSLTAIVAGIGSLVLIPAAFCLSIAFPPPKQRRERLLSAEGLRFLCDPFFIVAALALAIQSGMEGMSNDWMTRYFKSVKLDNAIGQEWRAQLSLVALTGAMVLARLALFRLLTRISSRITLFVSIALAACGALLLRSSAGYETSLAAVAFIGAGLAAAFPVVLGYVGDRYPFQSGTAFSMVFVIALLGNMAINKTFGYVAQQYGIEQYPLTLLALLTSSGLLLAITISQLRRE
jgi:MFS transporter, FHS family, glucose/mannose:H+ symporter